MFYFDCLYRYGLILPSKVKSTPSQATRKLNPLLDSDDELEKDDESPLNWVEASLKVHSFSALIYYMKTITTPLIPLKLIQICVLYKGDMCVFGLIISYVIWSYYTLCYGTEISRKLRTAEPSEATAAGGTGGGRIHLPI